MQKEKWEYKKFWDVPIPRKIDNTPSAEEMLLGEFIKEYTNDVSNSPLTGTKELVLQAFKQKYPSKCEWMENTNYAGFDVQWNANANLKWRDGGRNDNHERAV